MGGDGEMSGLDVDEAVEGDEAGGAGHGCPVPTVGNGRQAVLMTRLKGGWYAIV